MILTLKERVTLLNILPPQGDFTTLKLLREYREALGTDETERALFRQEYACPKCKGMAVLGGIVKCADCDVYMLPTGNVTCTDWDLEKDILIGKTAMGVTVLTLKTMEEMAKQWQGHPNPPQALKMLTDEHYSLYEKFCLEETAIPEAITKSMEESK